MKNLTKNRLAEATTTPAIIAAITGFDNNVNRRPQPITPDMPYYVAQTNRILWERWEAAAIALFNLRNEEIVCDRHEFLNNRTINRLMRRFPNIDQLFPAAAFEPEYDEMGYDCEPSNRLEGVAL